MKINNIMKKYNCISLSGGSNKGIAYLGVIKSLENNNILKNINVFAGTSIGSLFATLLCMNFKFKDLSNFINFKYRETDVDINNFLSNYGFSSGVELINFFSHIISQKCDPQITFNKLFSMTKKRLVIIAIKLENEEVEYFDYKTKPDMKILDAIRISINIPFLFTSQLHNGFHYIDGALLENQPINCFNNDDKVLKILLSDEYEKEELQGSINNLEDYIFRILLLIKKKKIVNDEHIDKDTINIILPNVNPFDFNLNKKLKLKMFKIGFKITTTFFLKINENEN